MLFLAPLHGAPAAGGPLRHPQHSQNIALMPAAVSGVPLPTNIRLLPASEGSLSNKVGLLTIIHPVLVVSILGGVASLPQKRSVLPFI